VTVEGVQGGQWCCMGGRSVAKPASANGNTHMPMSTIQVAFSFVYTAGDAVSIVLLTVYVHV